MRVGPIGSWCSTTPRRPLPSKGFISNGVGTVLVTTRDVGSRSTASLIDINPLLPPDAEQLLRDETGRDEPELSLLARELWNVPVLMQAAPARSRASSAVAVLSVRQLTA